MRIYFEVYGAISARINFTDSDIDDLTQNVALGVFREKIISNLGVDLDRYKVVFRPYIPAEVSLTDLHLMSARRDNSRWDSKTGTQEDPLQIYISLK